MGNTVSWGLPCALYNVQQHPSSTRCDAPVVTTQNDPCPLRSALGKVTELQNHTEREGWQSARNQPWVSLRSARCSYSGFSILWGGGYFPVFKWRNGTEDSPAKLECWSELTSDWLQSPCSLCGSRVREGSTHWGVLALSKYTCVIIANASWEDSESVFWNSLLNSTILQFAGFFPHQAVYSFVNSCLYETPELFFTTYRPLIQYFQPWSRDRKGEGAGD